MSRRSVLVPLPGFHSCEICRAPITNDVARVDGGRLFHMSCFDRYLGGTDRGMRACPVCWTVGSVRSRFTGAREECRACRGIGYLGADRAVS